MSTVASDKSDAPVVAPTEALGEQFSHATWERTDGDATAAEVRRKALSSVGMVAKRDAIVKGVAMLGNIAFARILTPTNFGAIAFGLTLLLFAQMMSDGGLGAGLIRRPTAPDIQDLRVLLGYQLVISVFLMLAIVAISMPFGHAGLVTAVMMPALPLLALRTPSMIVFERNLTYGPLVKAEIAEQLAYYAFGAAALILGAGVWGVAVASVVKALVGSLVILSVSSVSSLTPSYSLRRLRPMLNFGVRVQAVQLTNLAGLQALNIGIAAAGSLAVLGVWTLAWRLAQIPFLLFGALWRVSYATMAQLLAAGESARAMIERGVGLAAVATGFIMVPIFGAVWPLVGLVLGPRWTAVAYILPIAFLALQGSGPVSVATAGYLYAVGDAAAVLIATAVTAIVWLAVALLLVPYLGAVGAGVGWAASSLVEIPLLARPVRRRTNASLLRPIASPWIAATLAGVTGWVVSRNVGHGISAAVAGAAVATLLYALPMMALRRDAVMRLGRLMRSAVAAAKPDLESPVLAVTGGPRVSRRSMKSDGAVNVS
jgi:O-antigen/teichoic acid export membrane protein